MRRARPDLKIVAAGERFHLIDPYGIRPTRTVSELELAILQALGAGAKFAAIRELARRRGIELERDDVAEFAAELERAGMFDGPEAVAARREAVERALVGDTLVVPAPHDAAARCRALLDEARAANAKELGPRARDAWLEGFLSPHGDLETTGEVAARAYALLAADRWPDVFVIVGTSHYGGRPSISLRDVHTPLGTVRCHREFAERLAVACRLERDAPELVAEHSWRQDLPLLQTAARDLHREPRIVAILIGNADHARARALGRAIRDLAFRRLEHVCVVASGDLTHFGAGYRWWPTWLAPPRTIDQIVAAIQEHERPALAAIAACDQAGFERQVADTSFCARAQVATLIERVTTVGRVLAHRAVVDWRLYDAADAGPWTPATAMFGAASLVFACGLPVGPRPRPCGNVIVKRQRGRLVMIHRCTLASHEIPAGAAPVMQALWSGTEPADFDPDDVRAFVAMVERTGLFHTSDPPSHETPRSVLVRAPHGWATAGFTTPDDLRVRAVPDAPRRGVFVRTSSASSGKGPVTTVVETAVRDERSLVEMLIQPVDANARIAHINRPANLRITGVRRRGTDLVIAPGPNPTAIASDAWSRAIEALTAFAPDHLEGDPAYLAALAHECLVRRVALPRVTAVFAGHGYAWEVYRAAIRSAFGVEPTVRYHASELGEIALACHLGRLHLLDLHVLYEVLADGKPAALGQLGQLVATTLDTKIRPLVRYANGDVVRVTAPACTCGKPFRVIEFAGRVSQLIPDARGRPITYPDLDAAIGAPPGVRFFQLAVAPGRARLTVVPAAIDPAALRDRLGELLHRRVTIRVADRLDVAPGAKLGALRTPDFTAHWSYLHEVAAGTRRSSWNANGTRQRTKSTSSSGVRRSRPTPNA